MYFMVASKRLAHLNCMHCGHLSLTTTLSLSPLHGCHEHDKFMYENIIMALIQLCLCVAML